MESSTIHSSALATRRLVKGEAAHGAAALVESHTDYPAFVALCSDRRRRRAMLRPFFEMTVRDGIAHGQVWAGFDGDTVCGAAVWAPPGRFPWSARRKLAAVPWLLQVALAAPRSFGRFSRYGANAERAHPDGEHWYLVVAGVRPDRQRQGVGARMLAPVLRAADDSGIGCYLETSDPANVAYYARFGFEVVGTVQLVPGGPPHTGMRRAPLTPAPS
jgi:GNAT superfamily N-acetyltransferase